MIDLTRRGDVAILRIAHGKANALDTELCQALTAQMERLRASPNQAVVLTGSGTVFSAGVDLVRLLDEGVEYLHSFLPALTTMFETVFFHPQPVVAAVNGHAIAGGCVIACAADQRLMGQDAGRIGVPELLVGVAFPTIALEIMRRGCHPQHFERLIYGGATCSPEEGAALGLVHDVVAPPDLLDRAVAAAEKLRALPPDVFALTKQQIRQPVRERRERARAAVEPAVHAIWTSAETRETIRRYVSRTFKKSQGG
jgi:enoyl-CoA hydratase